MVAMSRFALLAALALLLPGCALFRPQPQQTAAGPSKSDKTQAANGKDQRHILNQGYSILYNDANGLSHISYGLYVKVESDDVDHAVTAISDYAAKFAARLEAVKKDFPAVRIDLDPQPVMYKRARAAVSTDRKESLAPLVGRTGTDFERTVLLTLSGALNNERHLCQVMAAGEPVPALKKILQNAQSRYSALYDRVVKLLNEQYFIKDAHKGK